MPTWGYSITKLDPERSAIASGRDMPISFKDAVEICRSIKGLDIESAKRFLEDVIAMKRMVPIKRYKKKLPHHSLQGWYAGRYPVKASKYILDVVKQLEANAEYKGLDTSRLKIIHAAAQKGMVIKKYIPRAYGRSTPYFRQTVHVELAAVEVVK